MASPGDSRGSQVSYQQKVDDGEDGAVVTWTNRVLTANVLMGTGSVPTRPSTGRLLPVELYAAAAPSNIQQLPGSGDSELPQLLGFHHSARR